MAEYLPKGWSGKKVAVVFRSEGGLTGSLIDHGEGGVVLQIVEKENTRTLFTPWSSIRYIELLEQAEDTSREHMIEELQGI
jgi:hypothetical protein